MMFLTIALKPLSQYSKGLLFVQVIVLLGEIALKVTFAGL